MVKPIENVVEELGIKPGSTEDLSPEQHNKLAESVNWEDEEKPNGEEKKDPPQKDDVPDDSQDDKKPEDDPALAEKAEKERVEKLAQEQGKSVEEILSAEKALKDESARLEEKAKEEKKTVEQIKAEEKAAAEKAETETINQIALDEGVSLEKAREIYEKDKGIVERHANDPRKLARAIRLKDSEFSKVQQERDDLKAAQEKKERMATEQELDAKCEEERDLLIEKWREQNPGDDEDSDEVVFERAKAVVKRGHEIIIQQEKKQLNTKATEKRAELLNNLPAEYLEFKPALETKIASFPADQILNPKFDINYLANYERGKKYTPAYVKKLVEDAEKRGRENPSILGADTRSAPKKPSAGSGKESGIQAKIASLTSNDKTRAKEIYGRRGWTEDKIYEEYAKNDKEKDNVW